MNTSGPLEEELERANLQGFIFLLKAESAMSPHRAYILREYARIQIDQVQTVNVKDAWRVGHDALDRQILAAIGPEKKSQLDHMFATYRNLAMLEEQLNKGLVK
jgi:hypothetical protein